jgi:hypothetical protein
MKNLRPIQLVSVITLVSLLGFGFVLSKAKFNFGQDNVDAQAAGTTYYVSPSGNDSNSGTAAGSAWQTTSKVNSMTFGLGDKILFEGGQTFQGNVYLDQTDIGSAAAPIEVSSYGSGRATISSGNQNGIFVFNAAGVSITNINFTGDTTTTDTNSGILFYTELPGDVYSDHIKIEDVEIQRYKTGISIGGWNGKTGYKNVRITKTTVHDVDHEGMNLYGQNLYSIKDVYIAYNHVYNIPGIGKGFDGGSGTGIVVGKTDKAVVERNIAHDGGSNGDANVGIWTYDSNNVTIQFNESYNNKTTGIADGGGFDLDGGVTNSVMQYNYSHDNDGAGYGLYQYPNAPAWSNNVVRYNISQNDGKKNKYGGITIWSGGTGLTNAQIYNNTVFAKSYSGNSNFSIVSPVSNIYVRNNIFVTTGGATLVSVIPGQSNVRFQGNNYYTSGSSFKITWQGQTYSSLSGWRSGAGQEKNGSTSTGFSTNPKLVNPGNGGIIGDPDKLGTLTHYQLQSSSPMRDAGLNLLSLFSVNPGPRDYYGFSLPQGSSYDIGAHEFSTNATPVPTSTPTATPVATTAPTAAPTGTPLPTTASTPQPSGSASTVSLLPAADTYVRSDSPTRNYGLATNVSVAGGGIVRITYLKFDLSNLAGQIKSAKLRMYNTNGTDGLQVISHTATNTWTETGITYDTRPAQGGTITSFVPGELESTWVEANLTSGLVGKEGQVVSLGMTSTDSDSFSFNTKEFTTDSLRPRLVIELAN